MHTPRKRFGQNFLNSEAVIVQMVKAISPRRGNQLVEIGPGQGALTDPLLNSLDPSAHMDVIELDRDLIPVLRAKFFKFLESSQLEIHEGDVLNFDFQELINSHSPSALRIVGNLPYNISTDLLFYLLNFLPGLTDMHFLLQKEVVDRLAAPMGSSEYSRLSVLIQYYCEVEPLFLVSPDNFYPVPKVMSQFVRLIPRTGDKKFTPVNFKHLDQVLRTAFQMRRKTLRNNFKKSEAIFSDAALISLEINPEDRPQNLKISDFVNLAQLLSSHSQD